MGMKQIMAPIYSFPNSNPGRTWGSSSYGGPGVLRVQSMPKTSNLTTRARRLAGLASAVLAAVRSCSVCFWKKAPGFPIPVFVCLVGGGGWIEPHGRDAPLPKSSVDPFQAHPG